MFRGLSVNPISCRVIMYIRLVVLVRGISLLATQLFVIATENILRGVCGQSNKRRWLLDTEWTRS